MDPEVRLSDDGTSLSSSSPSSPPSSSPASASPPSGPPSPAETSFSTPTKPASPSLHPVRPPARVAFPLPLRFAAPPHPEHAPYRHPLPRVRATCVHGEAYNAQAQGQQLHLPPSVLPPHPSTLPLSLFPAGADQPPLVLVRSSILRMSTAAARQHQAAKHQLQRSPPRLAHAKRLPRTASAQRSPLGRPVRTGVRQAKLLILDPLILYHTLPIPHATTTRRATSDERRETRGGLCCEGRVVYPAMI